jgi:hypothetical protein
MAITAKPQTIYVTGKGTPHTDVKVALFEDAKEQLCDLFNSAFDDPELVAEEVLGDMERVLDILGEYARGLKRFP